LSDDRAQGVTLGGFLTRRHEIFECDAVGNLLTASNVVARESFTYDVIDRLATANTTLGQNVAIAIGIEIDYDNDSDGDNAAG
jgi:mannitol/fructose-specific phosphotransferase system IIA component